MNALRKFGAPFFTVALVATVLMVTVAAEGVPPPTRLPQEVRSALTVFDSAIFLVEKHFYDKGALDAEWRAAVSDARGQLPWDASEEALRAHINRLLRRLHSSHTGFFTDADQEAWALRSIYSGNLQAFPLPQSGAWFQRFENRWFVRNVFQGSPAEGAGWLPGDEIVSVNGKPMHPVRSFVSLARVVLRRSAGEKTWTSQLRPRDESFQRMLLAATQKSFRIFVRDGLRVGYLRLWCGSHDEFKATLRDFVTSSERLHAFVLDLRDGFGGADPSYLEPFHEANGLSGKLVGLINGGTRSGKEWLAHEMKHGLRAVLVGERTAGAFLAGKIFRIEPQYLLSLAVSLPPKEAPPLEGNGIDPDFLVPLYYPYSGGKDPQLDRALDVAFNL